MNPKMAQSLTIRSTSASKQFQYEIRRNLADFFLHY
jgi:hypothetical protein